MELPDTIICVAAGTERIDKVMNSYRNHIVVLHLNVEIIDELYIAGKCAENNLEKRVDGADIEIGIVEQQIDEGASGGIADLLLRC